MKYLILSIFVCVMISCSSKSKAVSQSSDDLRALESIGLTPVLKSDEEWKSSLSEMEYYVIREKGTERPFSGDLWDHKEDGIYTCRACALPLFDSKTKFKSGTGWPSYFEPVKKEYIREDTDHLLGYARTEVMCNRCGGHLGHVFTDGPKPTGLRYCINSASLDFENRKSKP